MSFNKFSTKKEEGKNGKEPAQVKKKQAAKINPLLSAKTDQYVDDNDLYKYQINYVDKAKHYEFLVETKERRQPPKEFESWIQKEMQLDDELTKYHWWHKSGFNFIKSARWDHFMLNLFMIVLLVGAAAELDLIETSLSVLIMTYLSILMFVSQLIPFVGTFYFTCNCNDLVRFMASLDFAKWAFASCLTAQYIEYFYYSGQGKREQAGNVRIGHVNKPGPVMKKIKGVLAGLRKRGAKIGPEEEDDDDYDDEYEDGRNSGSYGKSVSDLERGDSERSIGRDAAESGSSSRRSSTSKSLRVTAFGHLLDEKQSTKAAKQAQAARSAAKAAEAAASSDEEGYSNKKVKNKQPGSKGSEESAGEAMSGKKSAKSSGSKKNGNNSSEVDGKERPGSASKSSSKEGGRPSSGGKNKPGSASKGQERGDRPGSGNSKKSQKGNRPGSAGGEGRRPGSGNRNKKSGGKSTLDPFLLGKSNDRESKDGVREVKEEDGESSDDASEEEIEFVDWTCLVCGADNHKPRYPPDMSDISFGSVGVFFKRTYAVITPRRRSPTCYKCTTYMDYRPPPGSEHLFTLKPYPNTAMTDYPKPVTVQAGMTDDPLAERFNRIKSFFFGLSNDPRSTPVANDWRLRKYLANRYAMMPRLKLEPGDRYQVGEIVECRQQKSDWVRTKIISLKPNHMYDIKYDTGEELRFVLESALRMVPEKRRYAYRVEMAMVVIVVFTPLGMLLALTSGDAGLIALPLLLSMATLLALRFGTFVQYLVNFYNSGCITIFAFFILYGLPVLLLTAAAGLAVSNAGSDPSIWPTVANLMIASKAFSLPVLYIMRPAFLVIACPIFLLTSIGISQLANQMAYPEFTGIVGNVACILAFIVIKYLRIHLHSVWDVCLVIRPAMDTASQNPNIIHTTYDYLKYDLLNF